MSDRNVNGKWLLFGALALAAIVVVMVWNLQRSTAPLREENRERVLAGGPPTTNNATDASLPGVPADGAAAGPGLPVSDASAPDPVAAVDAGPINPIRKKGEPRIVSPDAIVLQPQSIKELQRLMRNVARPCLDPLGDAKGNLTIGTVVRVGDTYVESDGEPKVTFTGVEAPPEVVTCVADAVRGAAIPLPAGQAPGQARVSFTFPL